MIRLLNNEIGNQIVVASNDLSEDHKINLAVYYDGVAVEMRIDFYELKRMLITIEKESTTLKWK